MPSPYTALLLDTQRYAPTHLRPTTDPRRRSPTSPEYSPRSPPHSSRSPRCSPQSAGIVSRPQYTPPEDTTSGMKAVAPTYQLVNSLKQRQKQITRQIKRLEQEHANIDGMLNDLRGESVPRYIPDPASKRRAAGAPTTTEPSPSKKIALGTTLPCYTPASPPCSPANSARERPATAYPTTGEPSPPKRVALSTPSPCYTPASPPPTLAPTSLRPTTDPRRRSPTSPVLISPTSPPPTRESRRYLPTVSLFVRPATTPPPSRLASPFPLLESSQRSSTSPIYQSIEFPCYGEAIVRPGINALRWTTSVKQESPASPRESLAPSRPIAAPPEYSPASPAYSPISPAYRLLSPEHSTPKPSDRSGSLAYSSGSPAYATESRTPSAVSEEYEPTSPIFANRAPRLAPAYVSGSPAYAPGSPTPSTVSEEYEPTSPIFAHLYPSHARGCPEHCRPVPTRFSASPVYSSRSSAYATESPTPSTVSEEYEPTSPIFANRTPSQALRSPSYATESAEHGPRSPSYSPESPSVARRSPHPLSAQVLHMPLQISPASPTGPQRTSTAVRYMYTSDTSRLSFPSLRSPLSSVRPASPGRASLRIAGLRPASPQPTQLWSFHSQYDCLPNCLPNLGGHAVGCGVHPDLFQPLPVYRTDGTREGSGAVNEREGTLEGRGGVKTEVFE